MRKLFNKFIGYTDRTIEQQEASIIAKIATQDGVPEMTDHSYSNPFIKIIKVWTGISELFHAYIDNMAQEIFLVTAKEFKSASYFAKFIDYRIRGRISASVDQRFYIDTPATENIIIPAGTRVKSTNDILFVTQQIATIVAGNTEVIVAAKNEVSFTNQVLGVGTGLPRQKVVITNDVVDNSISFLTNALNWTPIDTLAYSQSNAYNFVAGLNENGIMELRMGDGVNGAMPGAGINMVGSYKKCNGKDANLPANTITIIDGAVTVPSGVVLKTNNPQPSSGGANEEGVEEVKKNATASIKTLEKAVRLEDYEALANKAPGVAKAKAKYENKKVIDLYIAPIGSTNGIASTALISSTTAYMLQRCLVGKQINVQSAGIITVKLEVEIELLPGFIKTQKEAETKTTLANFLSITEQDVFGSVAFGNLYQRVEAIEGVFVSRIKLLNIIPYARPLNHETQLTWTRNNKATSTNIVRWNLLHNDSTTYKLLKDGSFVGTFSYGAPVNFDEIDLTVTNPSGYAANSSWEFYTYPYNKELYLNEPSIPVSDASNIVVTSIGGI